MKRGAAATQGADKAPQRGDRTDDLADMASEA